MGQAIAAAAEGADAVIMAALDQGDDLTMETGLAKLRALDVISVKGGDLENIRWKNAARIFPNGSFPRCAWSDIH